MKTFHKCVQNITVIHINEQLLPEPRCSCSASCSTQGLEVSDQMGGAGIPQKRVGSHHL